MTDNNSAEVLFSTLPKSKTLAKCSDRVVKKNGIIRQDRLVRLIRQEKLNKKTK